MFKNYLKIICRNIKKQKTYFFINIGGLAMGFAGCIILALYINYELSFDTYHENVDDIHRLCVHVQIGSTDMRHSSSNALSADFLKEQYPEVVDAVRFRVKSAISGIYKETDFRINRLRYVDASVFNIFTFPMLKGNPESALKDSFTIVITETTASNIFGDEDPLGKFLVCNNGETLTVTGVIKDFPEFSTMRYNGLVSIESLYTEKPLSPILTGLTSFNFKTFLLLDSKVDPVLFEGKIKRLIHEYAGEELEAKGATEELFLQPMRDIYLNPLNATVAPIHYVYIFSAVAIFILLIACINFMNLSTARSANRALEVGMRKTLGSSRRELIIQFLSEAVALSIISLFFSIVITLLILPTISEVTGRELTLTITQAPWLLPGLLGLTILVGLIAGSYPAFVLSGFQPVSVLKGKTVSTPFANRLRRVLVVFQFAISVALIIGTGIIMNQLDFLKNRDAGFNKEHVLVIPIYDSKSYESREVLKEKFKNINGVISVGLSSSIPSWGCPSNDKIPEGFTRESTQLMGEISVDEDYIPTLGMKLVAGRNFSKKFSTDRRNSVIVNETAVKTFGWTKPIGKTIKAIDAYNLEKRRMVDMNVIGVVKDFNQRDVSQTIKPLFIANYNDYPFSYNHLRIITVRIAPDNIEKTIGLLEERWNEIISHRVLDYSFMDEEFNWQFRDIENSREIASYFTFLAILIACLGLLGLASFTAEQRTKEIGIRKVLGSSNKAIVYMLSKELMLLVLIANIVAWPFTYYVLNSWLQDFPYRIDIEIITFIGYSLLVFIIGWSTIAFQAIKAALANPIDSLRND